MLSKILPLLGMGVWGNGQEFWSLFLVFELSQPIWDCLVLDPHMIFLIFPPQNLDSPRQASHKRLKVILTHHSIKPSWQKRLMFCLIRGKKTFPFFDEDFSSNKLDVLL